MGLASGGNGMGVASGVMVWVRQVGGNGMGVASGGNGMGVASELPSLLVVQMIQSLCF